MNKPIEIGQNYAIANLLKYAKEVVTSDGRKFYQFPFWFEQLPGNFEFLIHPEMPEELSMFICKSGLGGDNPKPIQLEP